MLGEYFPRYEAFAEAFKSSDDSGDEYVSLDTPRKDTPRKPLTAMPSNLQAPKSSPQKQALTYAERLLNGSFDEVVIETPESTSQKRMNLRYMHCSSDSSASSSPAASSIPTTDSGTSDYMPGRDRESDAESSGGTISVKQEELPSLLSKEERILICDQKRSYLTGVQDIEIWLALTFEIADLQYNMLNNEGYLNVLIGAYNMIHLGDEEYKNAKKKILLRITDEMYSYIDDVTLIQDPYRAPFSPADLCAFYFYVDFLLFNHCSLEERITVYRKLISVNSQMKKQHRIDLYSAWIGYHECMLKINWQILAYEDGQPDSGIVQDVQDVFLEVVQHSQVLWNNPYSTGSEKVELAFNLSRISYYLDDLDNAHVYRDLFNQFATLADNAKKNQLDLNIQKLIDKEQDFQKALAQLDALDLPCLLSLPENA